DIWIRRSSITIRSNKGDRHVTFDIHEVKRWKIMKNKNYENKNADKNGKFIAGVVLVISQLR
nr:hypothetical protein [Nitrosopumilus sp.]